MKEGIKKYYCDNKAESAMCPCFPQCDYCKEYEALKKLSFKKIHPIVYFAPFNLDDKEMDYKMLKEFHHILRMMEMSSSANDVMDILSNNNFEFFKIGKGVNYIYVTQNKIGNEQIRENINNIIIKL